MIPEIPQSQIDAVVRRLLATVGAAEQPPPTSQLEQVYNATLATIANKVTRYVGQHGNQPGEMIAAIACSVATTEGSAMLGPRKMVDYAADQVAQYFEHLDGLAHGQPLSRVEVIQAFDDLVQMQRVASQLSAADMQIGRAHV